MKKKGLGRKKQADETPRTERGFFFPSSSSHPLHFFPLHIGDAGRRRELSFFCRRELEAKIGIQTSRLSLSPGFFSFLFFFPISLLISFLGVFGHTVAVFPLLRFLHTPSSGGSSSRNNICNMPSTNGPEAPPSFSLSLPSSVEIFNEW